MAKEQLFLGNQMQKYCIVRREGNPYIPCDPCMGGMDAPWYIAFYMGQREQVDKNEAPLVYVICAACAVQINEVTDTCGDCIPDPTGDRTCDSCGKEYRRAKQKAPVEVAA